MTSFNVHNALHSLHGSLAKKMRRAGCPNGLYLAPTLNQQVDSSQQVTISWDNTCFDPAPQKVDIYLVAPMNTKADIHYWTDVDYAKGTVQLDLRPKWWNSTASVQLQLNIVESGTPPFLTKFVAGPLFVANYDATTATTAANVAAAADTSVPDEPFTSVNNSYKPGGLSKGALAAAVLIPLIFVAVAVGVYVKYARSKEAQKRKRWSAKVDARMSTISTEWKSITPAGANAAIRNSMAMSTNGSGNRNTRASSFFAGNGPAGRPSSTFAAEGGQAGVGARWGAGIATEDPQMVQIPRPRAAGIGANGQARVSRVSFAADPRPSIGGERQSIYDRQSMYTTASGTPTRSYHRSDNDSASEVVPPLPPMSVYYANGNSSQYQIGSADEMQISPTQTQGPYSLTPDQIRAKISDDDSRPSVDGELLKMPALTLMRTSNNNPDYVVSPVSASNEYFSPTKTGGFAYPTDSRQSTSPVSGSSSFMPTLIEPHAANAMSPDAMLAAYAAKKRPTSTRKASGPVIESTNSANGGMRVLYQPHIVEEDYSNAYADAYNADTYGSGYEQQQQEQDSKRLTVVGDKNPFRTSMAGQEYEGGRGMSAAFSEGSRYSGIEESGARAQ